MIKNVKKEKTEGGYSLVELMVSVTIFAIVMVACMGAVISIIDANRKAQALSSVMNNLNAALEDMTRAIKTGSGLVKKTNESFIISESGVFGGSVTYYLDVDPENSECSSIKKSGASIIGVPITAPEVCIKAMNVEILNNADTCDQPYITLNIKGEAGTKDKVKTEFNIQSVVSQRLLELDGCS